MGIFFLILVLIGFGIIFFKKREWLGFYVLIILAFMPKFSVIKLNNYQNTNIVIDDFIILFYIVVSFVELFKFSRDTFKSKLFLLYTVYIVFCIISFAIGILTHLTIFKMFSFLSVVRKVEYFCYIFVGVDIVIYCKRKNLDYAQIFLKIMQVFIVYSLLICILQRLGAIGCFRQGVYDKFSAKGRAFGSFNGPYELAQFMTVILIFLLLNVFKNKLPKKELIINISCIACSIIVILLTKSRVMLLVSMFTIFIMVMVYGNKKVRLAVGITVPAAAVLILVGSMFITIKGFERFASLNPKGIYNSIVYAFRNRSYENYKLTLLGELKDSKVIYDVGDYSLNTRLFKWASVLDLFLKYPLFGVGFGSNSVLDGNIVKLLVESGIFGTVIFLTVLIYCIKLRKNSRLAEAVPYIVISLIAGSILIDIFDSSKCMEFFWLIIGMCLFKVETNIEEIKNKNTPKKLIKQEEKL